MSEADTSVRPAHTQRPCRARSGSPRVLVKANPPATAGRRENRMNSSKRTRGGLGATVGRWRWSWRRCCAWRRARRRHRRSASARRRRSSAARRRRSRARGGRRDLRRQGRPPGARRQGRRPRLRRARRDLTPTATKAMTASPVASRTTTSTAAPATTGRRRRRPQLRSTAGSATTGSPAGSTVTTSTARTGTDLIDGGDGARPLEGGDDEDVARRGRRR